jgi:hypothetical protein
MLKMKWTLSAAIVAGMIATSAPQAFAQSAGYRGSFTLPFEARFGNVVLEPGQYEVKTLEGASGLRFTGDRKTVAILAAGYDVKPDLRNAKLVLVESNGMYALESFQSGAMGKTLHFLVQKNRGANAERASVVNHQTVEIALK